MKDLKKSLIAAFFLLLPYLLQADDKSDAVNLLNECEQTSKTVEVALRNFGDAKDAASFDDGLNVIKQGKVMMALSKFKEAKARFLEYQKTEFDLYKSLAAKYLRRTQEMIDTIAVQFADYVNQKDVLQNLNDAVATLDSAKANFDSKAYMIVIKLCRSAKDRLLSCYSLVKKAVPDEYKKDLEDYALKIHKE
jgi:hypothetical protein